MIWRREKPLSIFGPAVQCKDVVSGSTHFNPFFLKT